MIRGFGASKMGMSVEQSRTDVLANNMANINTPGFKKSMAVSAEFEAMLIQRMGDSTDQRAATLGLLGNGATLDQVLPVDLQGDLQETGRALDFAIEGPGRFMAQGPNGVITTRNGAFRQTEDGTLVTAEGYPVVVRNQGGELSIFQQPGGAVEVQADGTLLAGGQVVGRLEMEGVTAETKIHSGKLEASNVELAKEMTDLIVALRSFQVNQRALQMQDQTLGKAVTEIGKI
ncbi:MAG: flagellar hook-basal body protein [Bacillota bacterium]